MSSSLAARRASSCKDRQRVGRRKNRSVSMRWQDLSSSINYLAPQIIQGISWFKERNILGSNLHFSPFIFSFRIRASMQRVFSSWYTHQREKRIEMQGWVSLSSRWKAPSCKFPYITPFNIFQIIGHEMIFLTYPENEDLRNIVVTYLRMVMAMSPFGYIQ